MHLPQNVIEALSQDGLIKAIKLLRKEKDIGLKEAKEMIEAYQQHPEGAEEYSPYLNEFDAKSTTANKTELPAEVLDFLLKGQKIEAIKVLRELQGLGLAEAKERVEEFDQDKYSTQHNVVINSQYDTKSKTGNMLIAVAVIGSFVWAMVNLVSVVGSIIVVLNKDGYTKSIFIIDKIQYSNDHEAGLSWGFKGTVADKHERLYEPKLANAKALNYRGLLKKFPLNTKLDVWYNPEVTDTLFQKRSLRVIPYSASLMTEEKNNIIDWLKYSLLPFVIIFILGRKFENRNKNEGAAVQRQ